MNNRDRKILIKLVEETVALSRMLQEIDEASFLINDEKMRATCMTLINIGELIKSLDNDFRESYKQIPWKKMAGFRDVAAHGYFTLRMSDVWIYASVELPLYSSQIRKILSNEVKNGELLP